jgi:DNA-binding GntR family transcriptional regulator
LIVALHEAPGHSACEHDEHQRIVDCIANGDAEGAARLMGEHLRDLQQHLALADPPAQPDLAQMLGLA